MSTPLAPNMVALAVATKWINTWRDANTSRDLDNYVPREFMGKPLKGFWIPGNDLIDILRETGTVSARTYFGVDENNIIHLLFVGVDANGNDMTDESKGQYIYDFTQPCPATCSEKGPLK
jgi:hypothetical protein